MTWIFSATIISAIHTYSQCLDSPAVVLYSKETGALFTKELLMHETTILVEAVPMIHWMCKALSQEARWHKVFYFQEIVYFMQTNVNLINFIAITQKTSLSLSQNFFGIRVNIRIILCYYMISALSLMSKSLQRAQVPNRMISDRFRHPLLQTSHFTIGRGF